MNGLWIYFRTVVGLDVDMGPNEKNQDWGFWFKQLGKTTSLKGEFGREWIFESVGGEESFIPKNKAGIEIWKNRSRSILVEQ